MDMLKATDRILTTHTGSLPRPVQIENLLVAIDRDATVRSNTKDLPQLLDQAVRATSSSANARWASTLSAMAKQASSVIRLMCGNA